MKAQYTPLFSIIIPTYNRAYLIEKTLKSILESYYSNYEVIIVDDGSTDNTEEVVTPYLTDNVFYYKKSNAERGAARNFGVRMAKGDYINFFDSDDLMYPNHFTMAKEMVVKLQNPPWFHHAYDYKNEQGDLIAKVTFNEKTVRKLYFDNILSPNGGFIRKDIALANPFEENRILASSEDWELWIRLNSLYPLQYSNTITFSVTAHSLRSLFVIHAEELIPRDLFLIKSLEENPRVIKSYGKSFNKFKADRYTFFMLKLAEEGEKKQVLKWAFIAIQTYPLIVFSKRFLASLKNTLIK